MKKEAESKQYATKKDVNKAVENLAIIFANSFESFGRRLDKRLDIIENTVKATRASILTIGDKFVGRKEFDIHVSNFNKFEKKVKEKIKI